MAEQGGTENALLAEVREHLARISEAQHRLARQHADLLRDHLEARPGLASGAIRATAPVEASA